MEWKLLIPPNINVISKQVKRVNAFWETPKRGWYKLNFDGAAKGNPGWAGYGSILRNEDGIILGSIGGNMGVATNNEVETLAMVRGIKFCVDQGYSKVEIEGESQIVINAVIKQKTPNWKLHQYLDDIKQNLNRIQQYKITHVYREANRAMDQLANEGIIVGKGVEVTNWMDGMEKLTRL
ncbi:uncharacterized protein LOC131874396 [Cryptomeria japonica]|uniref:uncharacterized protein LOC131874396 n=1 Tax=Cryptomeria japonica TaxID=3369 RepID=UPI0027DA4EE0|nr:uncharacterized protein LOC131874396 [Cryptomeria japonica]